MELALRPSNLYTTGYVVQFTEVDTMLLRNKISLPTNTSEDEYYTVRHEDTLDGIAWRKYKNTVENADKYWWVIADANDIFNPLDISSYIGKEIIVPNIVNVLVRL